MEKPEYFEVNFVEIQTGSWGTPSQRNNTVYGLTEDGKVYKYISTKEAWVPLKMRAIKDKI